jgi:hypothetical protein
MLWACAEEPQPPLPEFAIILVTSLRPPLGWFCRPIRIINTLAVQEV